MDDISGAPIVRASGLSKQVDTGGTRLTILEDVSFEVAPGDAVAILGVSGSGKSTLLALLAGLDTPSAGRVTLAGADLSALDEDGRAELRARQIGFVFQSFQLLPAFTALENVMLPLELAGIADARGRARVMLERVGLGARIAHYPKQRSGGEQQRVAIARAFVREPRLVLADEPTGNLDADSATQVLELLRDQVKTNGAAGILVTHSPAAAATADRVLVLTREGLAPR